jgi:amidohydrolase
VIPQTAILRGTTRAYKKEIHVQITDRMQKLSTSIAEGFGCSAELTFFDGTLPVHNDETAAERVRAAIRPLFDDDAFDFAERTMGAEDMGYLMDLVPGMFVFLGSANAERGLNASHHHPRFDFDEAALPLGVAMMASAVAGYVMPGEL